MVHHASSGRNEVRHLECGDLSPLCSAAARRRVLPAIPIHTRLRQVAAQTKALTGQRTPKVASYIALSFLLSENEPL